MLKKIYKLISIILCLSMLLNAQAFSVFGDGLDALTILATQPNEEETLEGASEATPSAAVKNDWESHGTGYLDPGIEPQDIQEDYAGDDLLGGLLGEEELEPAYSNRELLPGARDQGNFNTCWAFATVCMAEASMITQKKADSTVDYSEFGLARFTYHHVKDPFNLTGKDSTTLRSGTYMTLGGNMYMAGMALSGWSGVNDETQAPYPATSSPEAPSDDIAYKNEAILKNAVYFPLTNRALVKTMIKKNGAVAIGMFAGDSKTGVTQYYHPYTKDGVSVLTYYRKADYPANHAVTIIGWDDNFPKEAFKTSSSASAASPASDGAWLVRNSWGSSFSDGGYFWISYESKGIGSACSMEFTTAGESWDNNYFYDGTVYTGFVSADAGDVVGNIFQAQQEYEILKAVNVGFYAACSEYQLQIYKNSSKMENPLDGTPQLSTPQTGSVSLMGLYTIELDQPVTLKKGEYFSVVLTFPNGAELFVDNSSTSSSFIFRNYCESGQSMYCNSGETTFQDFADNNICLRIKAYTKTSGAPTYTVTFDLNGHGSTQVPSQTVKEGELVSEPSPAPSASGYTFKGWYKESGCNNKWNFASDLMPASDLTLYAYWKSSGGGGGGGGGGGSGGGGGGSSSKSAVSPSSTGLTYSSFWSGSGDDWKVINPATGQCVKSAWLCDNAVASNGDNVWYLMNTDGSMLAAGFVQDNTGNFYSLETNHNGYYGSLRYKNGYYDCNGQQVYLEFSNKHDGTFGAVINPEGLEKLKAIYGITKFGVDNSSCVSTKNFV